MWLNMNFQRKDLTSAQKCHPSLIDFGETFAFNLIKQNRTHFSFIFLTQNVLLCPWKNLIFYCQVLQVSSHRINGGLSEKGCWSVPSPPRLCLFPSLICNPTKQPYLTVDNSRMHWYTNDVFTSNFYSKYSDEHIFFE